MTHKKPILVRVTDPTERASVERNGFGDIFGELGPNGECWAYKESVEEWRERQRQPHTDEGKQ